ncbi:NADH ubiquinone oxidoreductase-like protein [Calderihabitans maritimus]|uniref:NADH ubiquinone oxidoreductase-like protein n=1 Tax=Calderihabitans maritimus TaxID=1246530 RepID=A0A1Z5HV22_9FIRM|nr:oxidoreductase [Calderihabitans maritimus]GAW93258.1 NADH ubiquinone oxidoreductase-like protein [Calderihabitans maritimus]
MNKPSVAVYKLSSCAGCQLEIVNLEPILFDLLGAVDIHYFVMAKRDNKPGPYDIGLVEGAVTCGEEIARLKQARKECRILVAFGTCACFGGIPSIKNWKPQRVVESIVYEDLSAIHSTTAYGIDNYVPVEAYLKGCPVSKDELVEFIKSILLGVRPYLRPHSVCVECKLHENVCLAVTKGEPCMGPVTTAGCGALCPSHQKPCEGCRGPANDPNPESLAETFKEYGLHKRDIVLKFRKFAGMNPEFAKGADAV